MKKQTSHGVALKQDGTVWTWGRGPYGQLGHGAKPEVQTGRHP